MFKWEHNELTRYRELQDKRINKLEKYCKYLAIRMQDQAIVINEINPVIAASMFDDLEDAVAVSGIDDPREWAWSDEK